MYRIVSLGTDQSVGANVLVLVEVSSDMFVELLIKSALQDMGKRLLSGKKVELTSRGRFLKAMVGIGVVVSAERGLKMEK